ncbi:hypothetical protein [Sorangium sp. So ce1389]|uniref:hypothetical protein n=1 Tax=Sorangium sp. So ce1389 TaxID=3133336 RepID=UPI003F5F94FB
MRQLSLRRNVPDREKRASRHPAAFAAWNLPVTRPSRHLPERETPRCCDRLFAVGVLFEGASAPGVGRARFDERERGARPPQSAAKQ